MEMTAIDTPVATMLRGLQALPAELRDLVFTFMLQSPGGHILFNPEILDVLQKLISWPESKRYSVSCNERLFARWDMRGPTQYLAGMYAEAHEGVVELEANDQNWDLIVIRSDDFGIVGIELHNTKLTSTIKDQEHCVQILRVPVRAHREIWITLEGLFVSRIDLQREHTRRILWRSSAPLPLEDLPNVSYHAPDLAVEYSSLGEIRGISVAHSGREMVAIRTHTSLDNDVNYDLEHDDVTWGYCPIEVGEPIESICLVGFSCEGSGLVVNTTHKSVWLCPCIDQGVPQSYSKITTFASKGFFHNYSGKGRDKRMIRSLPDPPFISNLSESWTPQDLSLPTCPIPLPSPQRWHFSTAALCNVRRLRKSTHKGILFEYDNYSNVVGDFRPSEALEWIVAPRWYSVSTSDHFNHTIDFFAGALDGSASFRGMEGHIVMWFSGKRSFIQIQDSNMYEGVRPSRL
ncbi:hypothetical protein EK21DRAFT_95089 [Setomelanomma holmii]|uniref:Uncharacterized protein n=1 Tax=Setomelanomma holmii TaxID=210430 RepID=A0A9P4GXB0_9PLEO|nr:hypothetical protein EK21DRAFT_95089 [Setomelanomma holmii]